MKIVTSFGILFAAVIFCIKTGISVIFALLLGLVCFCLIAVDLGFSHKELLSMEFKGIKETAVVIKVMCIIGFVTAVWRAAGTISSFAYYGALLIVPELFLLMTFFLTCVLSYILGTSFGVAGTVGVIFMTLAKSGGVDPVMTAGVIMSGVYFGDRCSPASSGANMVAAVTGTELYDNVRIMLKTSAVPMAITVIIYGVFSVMNPLQAMSTELTDVIREEFSLSVWSFVPAVFMLVLPLFKVDVIKTMIVSIASGAVVAWLVEGNPLPDIVRYCISGYVSDNNMLGGILNGGGFVSMAEVVGILIISGAYSGIFKGTGMLGEIEKKLYGICKNHGRFIAMLGMSILTSLIFAIQAVAAMICIDLLEKPYRLSGGNNKELAIDIENSVMVISCMVPWGVGCSVPLAFMGADINAMPYAVYMYLLPIVYLFTKCRMKNIYIDTSCMN